MKEKWVRLLTTSAWIVLRWRIMLSTCRCTIERWSIAVLIIVGSISIAVMVRTYIEYIHLDIQIVDVSNFSSRSNWFNLPPCAAPSPRWSYRLPYWLVPRCQFCEFCREDITIDLFKLEKRSYIVRWLQNK